VTMNTTGTVHLVNAEADYYTGVTEILVATDALSGSFSDPGLLTGYTDNSCGFPQVAGEGSDVFIVYQEDFTDGLTVDGDIIYTYSWDTGSSFFGPFGLVADEFESVGPSVFTRNGVVGVLWLDAPAGGDEFELGARLAGGRGHSAMFGDVQIVTEQPRVEPQFHSCFGLATADQLHAAWIDRRDFPTQGHNVYTSRQLVAPDLGPFTPEGWSGSIVGNILRSSRTTAYLASEDTTWISFAMANNGLADITQDFGLELLLDGAETGEQVLGQWTLTGGMGTGTYFPVEEIPIFIEEPGDYTLTVNLDLLDSVAESNEANNTFAETWTWVPGAPEMRFTPGHITSRVVPEMDRSRALTYLSNPLTTHRVSLPVVQEKLAAALVTASESDLLRVMVVPARRLDPAAMGQALKDATRATRREVITGAARREVARFQDELAADLAQLRSSGKAAQVRQLWLSGMLAARLSPDAVRQLAEHPAVGAIFLDDVKSETFADHRGPVGPDRGAGKSSRADGWHLAAMGADLAWAQGATGAGIVVGHLDSGVAYDHPDLQAAMWDGGSSYPHHGWDAVDDDADPYDGDTDFWHGTHTAGLIIGDGTNGTTCGGAPGATLMALRAVPGYLDDLIEAMQFGLDNGVHLFNLSGGWSQPSETTRSANRYNAELLLSIDVAWICAAGNGDNYGDHHAVPHDIASPGDCPSPWYGPAGNPTAVFTVGAMEQDQSIWYYSSIGPTEWNQDNLHGEVDYHDYPYPDGLMKPDVAAPGGNVTSTVGGGGYVVYSGTSMATPLVTSAFCLIWSQTPQLLVPQMCELLESTATDLTTTPCLTGRDNHSGAGLINVAAALGQTPTASAELFWIHNDGDMPLVIHDVQWSDPWLDIVLPEMVIAPDDSLRATAFIDPALTSEGYHNCNVVFLSNEHRPGRILPVTLVYGEQVSAVDDTPEVLPAARLSNHPNPFNPRTVLEFSVVRSGAVKLQVFDLRGRLVRTLVDAPREAGRQQATWDGLDESGRAVASGQYFARLQTVGVDPVSRKLMLVR
jgi:subtilisin family serine protease